MALPLLDNATISIAGCWVSSSANEPRIAVVDPASGEPLARVLCATADLVIKGIEAAEQSLADEPSLAERRRWLVGIAEAMVTHREAIATIITRENGKPLREGRVEAEYAAGFFRFFATQLDHLETQKRPGELKGLHWSVRHRPAGVVGLITPWNFPIAMLAKKLAAAMAAGCAVVVKPAELTPLTTIALWHLMEGLGLPMKRFNLVLGNPAEIGRILCEHPAVRIISFTGSTGVGRKLIEQSAAGVKRLSLELGGNAPCIVLPDADLPKAADALVANKFRCAGQTCVCTNRVLVHRDVADAFAELVAERVRKLKVGTGMDESNDIGPLINRAGFDKVARHVSEAIAAGARRIVGDEPKTPPGDYGCFFPPTVLTHVTPDMLISREETFGPVIPIITFSTIDEGISLANGTPAGLAAYLFTGDAKQAEAIIARLHFGHVGLNTAAGPTPEAPFGGMKQSGFGREGGLEGLLEFCEVQTVVRA